VNSARAIEYALANEGIRTASIHGDMPPKVRERNFDRFKRHRSFAKEEGYEPPQVLVATDLASRGLDLPFVSHIINFDFPKTTSDYLHRAGRAGRAGRQGFVTSMYRERDLPLLEYMKESHDNLEPLKIGKSAYSVRNKEDL
jgi:superfamily II DNA/RNA helicase